MALYFFDTQDDERVVRDRYGVDLPDKSYIWEIAVSMVDEAVTARRHLRPPRSVSVVVRDEAGTVVYRSDHIGHGAGFEAEHSARETWTRPSLS